MKSAFLHGVILICFSSSILAQVCNEKQIQQTISVKNFTLTEVTNADATATDVITGLTWNRCVYGQKWNTTTKQCIGSPVLLTWSEALLEAEKADDFAGWRLPNIKELNSILDLQCVNPPYDLEIFPDTFASEDRGLWTSSPHVDNSSIQTRTNAWYIDLGQGKLDYRDAADSTTRNFARFVK